MRLLILVSNVKELAAAIPTGLLKDICGLLVVCVMIGKYCTKLLSWSCVYMLWQYECVLSDCNQALSLEFHNVKALFRRAQAYKVRLLIVYICVCLPQRQNQSTHAFLWAHFFC